MSKSSQFYTMDDLIDLFDLSKASIYKWRKKGKFPEPIFSVGKSPRWVKEEIDALLKEIRAVKLSDIKRLKALQSDSEPINSFKLFLIARRLGTQESQEEKPFE